MWLTIFWSLKRRNLSSNSSLSNFAMVCRSWTSPSGLSENVVQKIYIYIYTFVYMLYTLLSSSCKKITHTSIHSAEKSLFLLYIEYKKSSSVTSFHNRFQLSKFFCCKQHYGNRKFKLYHGNQQTSLHSCWLYHNIKSQPTFPSFSFCHVIRGYRV